MAIKQKLKKLLLATVPKVLKDEIERPYLRTNRSYSQEGEDLILNRLFRKKRNGFYVDIGAHHPYQYSNTYMFYKRGWRGINIDAMPGSMKLFNELRPEDINIELGAGEKKDTFTFYIFDEPALNTFSKAEADKKAALSGYNLIGTKAVEVWPIAEILDKYLPSNQAIDFLSIDVEGKDMEVLKSNDWERYRPTYLLVEDTERIDIERIIAESELYKYLTDLDYRFTAKLFNTLFFEAL